MLGFRPFLGFLAEWMDRWMDGWADFPCVLQDFIPFGAAALLPFNINQTLLKQGTGTADHLLPLGCYLCLCPINVSSIDTRCYETSRL